MIGQADPDHRGVDRGRERAAHSQLSGHLGTYITEASRDEVDVCALVISIPETQRDFVGHEVFATGHESTRGLGPGVEVGDAIDLDGKVSRAVPNASADGGGQDRVPRMRQVLTRDPDVQGLTNTNGRPGIEGERVDERFALPAGIEQPSRCSAELRLAAIEDADAVLDHAQVTKTGAEEKTIAKGISEGGSKIGELTIETVGINEPSGEGGGAGNAGRRRDRIDGCRGAQSARYFGRELSHPLDVIEAREGHVRGVHENG